MTSRSSLSILLQGEQSIALRGFSPPGFTQLRGTLTDNDKWRSDEGALPSYLLLVIVFILFHTLVQFLFSFFHQLIQIQIRSDFQKSDNHMLVHSICQSSFLKVF